MNDFWILWDWLWMCFEDSQHFHGHGPLRKCKGTLVYRYLATLVPYVSVKGP
jgi:hypothetical protein